MLWDGGGEDRGGDKRGGEGERENTAKKRYFIFACLRKKDKYMSTCMLYLGWVYQSHRCPFGSPGSLAEIQKEDRRGMCYYQQSSTQNAAGNIHLHIYNPLSQLNAIFS